MNEKKSLTTEETFALAYQNHKKNNLQVAENLYKETLKINPNHVDAHSNLGMILLKSRNLQKAKSCFEKAIEINPNYAFAHNNLGLVFNELRELQKAKSCFEKTIEINPNNASAHNNLGFVFNQLRELQKAKSCFEKAIQIQPNYSEAYWNLHSFASNIDEALNILIKLNDINNKFIKAKIMISALKGFKGKFEDFDTLIRSSESNHPMMRSIKWVFSLPKLPKIFFNRWKFFDAIVAQTNKSRPFYEFGVLNGISFQYLINSFKKGFGFDTFTGLPEDWHNEPSGTYSSFGSIPKIKGGEFIVGKFENTLPKFFSQKKPLASLINFDADLYSSTLCALNYSNKVIDEKTILVFDEFIMNKNWEKDEYKALNEFCNNFGIGYEVLAVSFFSKQVAIKLKKN
ncbi:tetratricopeptide repeat protein [Candidatus Pelagibacter sp.]|nr:tetratricopeptide repeat protein [Candidatus Pelagibacter sp.]